MDYSIDYNDDRFKQVEQQQREAIDKSNQQYNDMIAQNDQIYNDMKQSVEDYKTTQTDLQNQMTDQVVNKINQNKEWATKDYEKEQRGAYADYMKETLNQDDTMARMGIATNSGVSESAKIASWSAYQSRYSSARETYQKAIQDYDNQITDAKLQNNATIAEIAYNTLQKTLELTLDGFQYRNQLLQTQLENEQNLNNTYYSRYQDVLGQINQENSLKEQIRQYNEQMAYQKERDAIEDARYEREFALAQQQAKSSGSRSSGGGSVYSYTGIDNNTQQTTPTDPNGIEIKANPKTNTINPDTQYGVFKNTPYQPDNIGGVKLNSSGLKVKDTALAGSKDSSGKSMDSQTIWGCQGKYYVWDGGANSYKEVTQKEINGNRTPTSSSFDKAVGKAGSILDLTLRSIGLK